MSVVLITASYDIKIYSKDVLRSKTAGEILDMEGSGNSLLTYQNEYFREIVEDDVVPLGKYQDLVSGEYISVRQPKIFLQIVSEDYRGCYWFLVLVRTQMREEFPAIPIAMSNEFIQENTAAELLYKCNENLKLDIEPIGLRIGSRSVEAGFPLGRLREMARNQNIVFLCKLKESAIKKINGRIEKANEIISSEKSYINDLEVLDTFWFGELQSKFTNSSTDIRFIFKDIKYILDVQKKFYNVIRDKGGFNGQLSFCFISWAGNIYSKYTQFLAVYSESDKKITNLINQNKRYFNELAKRRNSRDISSYYVAPVQRPPRYVILLQSLYDATPDFHPEKPFLNKAVALVKNLNHNLNQQVGTLKKLLMFQNISYRAEGVTLDGNNIISHVRLKNNIELVTFTDRVYVFNVDKKNKLKLIFSFPTKFYSLIPMENYSAILYDLNKGNFLEVEFSEVEEKKSWISSVEKVSKDNYEPFAKNSSADFLTGSCIEVPDEIPPLINAAGCAVGEKIFIFGGEDVPGKSINSSMITYEKGTWTRILGIQMPKRYLHTCTTVGNLIYICFGKNYKTVLDDIWIYDPRYNRWEELEIKDPIKGRYGHSCVHYRDKLYIFGGYIDHRLSSLITIIDIGNNFAVTNIENHNIPARWGHSATVFRHFMVISCGANDTDEKQNGELDLKVWAYNFKDGTWRDHTVYLGSRCGHTTFCIKEHIVVFGGTNRSINPCLFIKFTDKNKFESDPSVEYFGNFPPFLKHFTAIPFSNKILVFGGYDQIRNCVSGSSWLLLSNYRQRRKSEAISDKEIFARSLKSDIGISKRSTLKPENFSSFSAMSSLIERSSSNVELNSPNRYRLDKPQKKSAGFPPPIPKSKFVMALEKGDKRRHSSADRSSQNQSHAPAGRQSSARPTSNSMVFANQAVSSASNINNFDIKDIDIEQVIRYHSDMTYSQEYGSSGLARNDSYTSRGKKLPKPNLGKSSTLNLQSDELSVSCSSKLRRFNSIGCMANPKEEDDSTRSEEYESSSNSESYRRRTKSESRKRKRSGKGSAVRSTTTMTPIAQRTRNIQLIRGLPKLNDDDDDDMNTQKMLTKVKTGTDNKLRSRNARNSAYSNTSNSATRYEDEVDLPKARTHSKRRTEARRDTYDDTKRSEPLLDLYHGSADFDDQGEPVKVNIHFAAGEQSRDGDGLDSKFSSRKLNRRLKDDRRARTMSHNDILNTVFSFNPFYFMDLDRKFDEKKAAEALNIKIPDPLELKSRIVDKLRAHWNATKENKAKSIIYCKFQDAETNDIKIKKVSFSVEVRELRRIIFHAKKLDSESLIRVYTDKDTTKLLDENSFTEAKKFMLAEERCFIKFVF